VDWVALPPALATVPTGRLFCDMARSHATGGTYALLPLLGASELRACFDYRLRSWARQPRDAPPLSKAAQRRVLEEVAESGRELALRRVPAAARAAVREALRAAHAAGGPADALAPPAAASSAGGAPAAAGSVPAAASAAGPPAAAPHPAVVPTLAAHPEQLTELERYRWVGRAVRGDLDQRLWLVTSAVTDHSLWGALEAAWRERQASAAALGHPGLGAEVPPRGLPTRPDRRRPSSEPASSSSSS
jgi:hypothetical protein